VPFTIRLELKGLEEIRKKLANKLSDFDKIPVIMLEEVQQAVIEAKSTVPVRTGALRDSIGIIDWNPSDYAIIAGTECHYAHFVEFGTVKMHARPYWTPAIWEAFFRIRERIKDEVLESEKVCRL